MVDQVFIDKIEELRHCTYSQISDLQSCTCPMYKKIYLHHQYEYWYEGYKHHIWEDDAYIYATNGIPYCYDNELKNTTFITNLKELILDSKIWPFLLFIGGKVIRWSDVTVVHDYNYTYLKIYNVELDTSFEADIIIFPIPIGKLRYGEDNSILVTSDRKGFYFGTDGKRLEKTDFVDIYLRLEILDTNIYYKEVDITKITNNTLQFEDIDTGFTPSLNNIITFSSDGTFVADGASEKFDDIYNGVYGLFDILSTDIDIKWAILVYNTANSNKEFTYLYTKEHILAREFVIESLIETDKTSELWTTILKPMLEKFDFDFDRTLGAGQNIANATKYITRYDFALWEEAFNTYVKIKSYPYTGLQFKALSDDKGMVRLSRKHTNLIEDVVMVFVNNKLYDYMPDITFVNNTINIPTFGIIDTDNVEVVMFNECNNNILELKVENEETSVYIHPEYNLEDCVIMSNEAPNDITYPLPSPGDIRTQYDVEFTYTVDENYNYNISFTHSQYYNKTLSLVPKRQFRYYRFANIADRYKFVLPVEFRYCHNPDQYMVFVNGRKINRTEYSITIMNEDRPFDKLVLYVAAIMDEGDYIDVFYVPEVMVEKYKTTMKNTDGTILLEDTEDLTNYPTTYPLSRYTSMLFIDGLKINPLIIGDVSLNCINIYWDDSNTSTTNNTDSTVDTNETYYVEATVIEYMVGNKEVAGYLKGLYEQIPEGEKYDPSKIDFNKHAADSWKEIIDKMLEIEPWLAESIFRKGGTMESYNGDGSFLGQFADLKSVLYDTVLDYYLTRDEVTTGDDFIYDFERESFTYDDSESNDDVLDIRLVPEKDKLLDYDVEATVATTEDVQEGKKFST